MSKLFNNGEEANCGPELRVVGQVAQVLAGNVLLAQREVMGSSAGPGSRSDSSPAPLLALIQARTLSEHHTHTNRIELGQSCRLEVPSPVGF